MKAKKVLAILLTAAMVFALAACGSSGGEKKEEAAPEGEAEEATEETAEEEATGEAPAELSGDLVVYTSAPEADNNTLLDGFGALYPDLNIELIEGNQGEGIARLQAEAGNPTIDVTYTGINESDGQVYADLYEPYVSPKNAELPETMQSNGFYNYNLISLCCICVNKDLAKELGVEITGYESLTDPKMKGKFIFADPTESSSAWNNVSNIFADYGYDSDEAWDLLERLLANGMVFGSSGDCFNAVANGEYVAGITYEAGPLTLIQQGVDNIEVVYPVEGAGGFLFASAVVKDAPHMEAAKALVDWLTSLEGQQVQVDLGSTQRRIADGLDLSNSVVPEVDEIVPRDIDWLIENKEAMIEKWKELYNKYQ